MFGAPGPATSQLIKRLNQRTVLEAVRAGAPISRAEVSRRVGISKPTVSVALESLLDAGVVRETVPGEGRPGYGAVYYEPVPEAAFVVGLDLGARFLRGAICDLRGTVLVRQDVQVEGIDGDAAFEAILELDEALTDAAGLDRERIHSAVVGVPGVVTAEGTLALSTIFPALTGREFGPELAARLGVPVVLENDVNLAALGEQWRGIAQGVMNFAFLTVGTGVGLGLVLDGALRRGQHGGAGEIGYAFSALDVEVEQTAADISALTARLAESAELTTALDPPYDVRSIFAYARADDPLARRVVDEVARRIALHVMPVTAVADPSLIVLGGGIGVNGDLLLEPVRKLLAQWLPAPPRVEVSSLGESAILIGALAVGLQAALDHVFDTR